MSDLPKSYEAQIVDNKWYAFWEDEGFFHADAKSEKPSFCIVMPPPNVTGVLHMGHALVNTLQDVLVRWKRMCGDETLWIPGTDHAGISTQTVVERHLMKTIQKKRKDFSREEFLSHVWTWKEENEGKIIGQLKRLGCSCDWQRLRFTMDEQNNRAVRTTFKKMFDDGLIYRGDYLVNWDPVTQTALADDEVEYEDRNSFLWHFKYPLKDNTGHVYIATTRPETMLGDTAIAVSPKDPRYAHLIGKTVVLPLMNREISIIADHHVDPEFGTGMVKVTPAHDPNDYAMGLAHQLPFINIMTADGHINGNGGEFEGLTMSEAREAIVSKMKLLGLLEKTEPHMHRVGVSYRSKATIEPWMSKQWFVRMSSFGKALRSAVEENRFRFIPKSWENTYFHWIDNLRDWCISRQLWWGHRIPIWYNKINPELMICWDGEGTPPEVAAAPDDWRQDEDVLDTWFSSALWPFSTLGWPDKTEDLKRFYPNSVLVTGHDILFFWVARMLLMGEYVLGELPFPETFIHGLIYGKSYWTQLPAGGIAYVSPQDRREYELGKPVPKDVHAKWEKMSKSKGNIIDPLEIIEQYGTDAMRMALCASPAQSREIDLDLRRFEDFKNFANKVWNGARFVFMNLDGSPELGTDPLTSEEFSKGLDETILSLEDHWILSALNRTVGDVNAKLSAYTFDQAAMGAYDFFWKEFCSYYVEIAKPVLMGKQGSPALRTNKQKLLVIILCQAVRLIHPMAPFITEELFQLLKTRLPDLTARSSVDPYTQEAIQALQTKACIIAPYPQIIRKEDINDEINQTFELVEKAVYTIRNIRGEMKIPPSTATEIHIVGSGNDPAFLTLTKNQGILSALVRITAITTHTEEPKIGFCCKGLLESMKILIPLPEDLVKQERSRLIKEKEKILSSLNKLKLQLENVEFLKNAPPQLIEKHKSMQTQGDKELMEVSNRLAELE